MGYTNHQTWFQPVIAIPAPDGRSATLAVRSGDDTFRGGKGKDSKGTTHKGKSKGSEGGKSGKSSKGGQCKSSSKSTSKGKGGPLKQRLVSPTQCRLCGDGRKIVPKLMSSQTTCDFFPDRIRKSTRTRNSRILSVCSTLFKKLVMEYSEEILNGKWLEYSSPSWTRSVSSHDQAIKWTKAKVCVYADSIPCVGQVKRQQRR